VSNISCPNASHGPNCTFCTRLEVHSKSPPQNIRKLRRSTLAIISMRTNLLSLQNRTLFGKDRGQRSRNLAAYLTHQNVKRVVLIRNSEYSTTGHNIISCFGEDWRITPCIRLYALGKVFISFFRWAKLIFHKRTSMKRCHWQSEEVVYLF
jgi:hypothetical protein